MSELEESQERSQKAAFDDAIQGLHRGDFSRLDPHFNGNGSEDSRDCPIIRWYKNGYFDTDRKALAEALTCACFLGRADVATFFLDHGVDPSAGDGTGLNAFHWAANRGQLNTVQLLVDRKAPLEIQSMYGGTVLGTAVWAAIHETKPVHIAIIVLLISAGANLDASGYPTGDEHIDEILRSHGANLQ